MITYVAMLRGINVGKNGRIQMERLRRSMEALGLEQVKTYIQSGNVVFKSGAIPPALSKKIEKQLLDDFAMEVPVILRTAAELETAVACNPLAHQAGIDPEKLHVMFLSGAAASAALDKLQSLTAAPEKFVCIRDVIYLYLPNGVSESKLMKASFDRILSVRTTTRNWKTVTALHHMCQECR